MRFQFGCCCLGQSNYLELQILVTCFDCYWQNCFSGCSIIKVAYEEHQLVLCHEQHWQLGYPSFDLPSCLVWLDAGEEQASLYDYQLGELLDFHLDFGCKRSLMNQHFPAEQNLMFVEIQPQEETRCFDFGLAGLEKMSYLIIRSLCCMSCFESRRGCGLCSREASFAQRNSSFY